MIFLVKLTGTRAKSDQQYKKSLKLAFKESGLCLNNIERILISNVKSRGCKSKVVNLALKELL